jgi:ATP-dependent Lhr-like helicase
MNWCDCDIAMGHSRKLDLSIEIPNSPLTTIMANAVWAEIYNRLIQLIVTHDTTLIFVNTRRLAERLSHNLNEKLGTGQVLKKALNDFYINCQNM